MTGIYFKGVFEGIYEWGHGYVSNEVRLKWDEFWKNFAATRILDGHEAINWGYLEPAGPARSGCLANTRTGVSVYMHPMGFSGAALSVSGAVATSGIDGNYDVEYLSHFDLEMCELVAICRAAADACGGSFRLFLSKEFKVESRFADDVHEVATREEYLREVAFKRNLVKHPSR